MTPSQPGTKGKTMTHPAEAVRAPTALSGWSTVCRVTHQSPPLTGEAEMAIRPQSGHSPLEHWLPQKNWPDPRTTCWLYFHLQHHSSENSVLKPQGRNGWHLHSQTNNSKVSLNIMYIKGRPVLYCTVVTIVGVYYLDLCSVISGQSVAAEISKDNLIT